MNSLQRVEIEELEELPFASENQEELEQAKERFKITDLDQLNWAFRKISALQTQKVEVDDLAQAELDRIKTWHEKEVKPIENSIQFFEFLIQEYHQQELLEDPKRKTLSTPFGKSKSRASKESIDQGDKEKLLEHVKSAGLDEFIKEEVKWGDYKKTLQIADIEGGKVVLDENGQAVEGVVIKPASTTFKVEVE